MSIVMSVNLKGGVAKTTTAVAVAECLATQGLRTLVIDADHQCMAGELLLGVSGQVKAEQCKRNLYSLFMEMMFNDTDLPPEEFEKRIWPKVSNIGGGLENLAVLPCSMRMDEIDDKIRERQKKPPEQSRSEIIERLRKRRGQFGKWLKQTFQFVIVDCPPSFGFPVKYFLSIADGYLVPCVPDRLSVRGSLYLMDRIKRGGFKIQSIGTLWSLFRQENKVHRNRVEGWGAGSDQELDALPRPFDTTIPNAAKISEAAELVGIGVAPKSFRSKYSLEFAKKFEDVSHELVKRLQWHDGGDFTSSTQPVGGPAGTPSICLNDEELSTMGKSQLHVLAGQLGIQVSRIASGNAIRKAILAARALK